MAQFLLTMMWYDERITYSYLDANMEKNLITKEEQQMIWVPKVVFENTRNKLETVMDKRTSTNIKNSNVSIFEITDSTNAEAVKQYAGDESLIVSTRFYNTEFNCIFQMDWYPFDTQVCRAVFGIAKDQEKFVILSSKDMEYVGSTDLALYYLLGKSQKNKNIGARRQVVVELIFGRRLLSIILTVFIPTLLLNLIGHSTNYFKPFFFEAVISLNVTVMLVLTTMFISVSNNLPKTAYIKMIDAWLIFNLFKPFTDILLQTYIESLRVSNEINHHGSKRSVDNEDDPDQVQDLRYYQGFILFFSLVCIYLKFRLINVDEQKQRAAMENHYKQLMLADELKAKIARLQRFGRVTFPGLCIGFIITFWALGLNHVS